MWVRVRRKEIIGRTLETATLKEDHTEERTFMKKTETGWFLILKVTLITTSWYDRSKHQTHTVHGSVVIGHINTYWRF